MRPPDTVVLVHGLWLTPRSWDAWADHYRARGYRVLTPAYPGLEVEVEALRADPSPIEALTVPRIVEHLERIIAPIDPPPLLIGHSAGGLMVQLLVARGHGAAAAALGSVPPQGVRAVPPSQIRSVFPVLRNPANRHRAVGFTREEFHYAFTNEMSAAASDEVHDRYHIPAPGNLVWTGVLANLTPGHHDTWVDTTLAERAPLLFGALERDHIMPPAVQRATVKRYRRSRAVTELHGFPGRCHYLGQDGWEEVADHALDWAVDQAARRRDAPEAATS